MQELEFNTGAIKPFECLKEAWKVTKPQYWILFAISMLGSLIGGATMYILIGAMICGIFNSYLKAIDGQKVVLDDLWIGFKFFWQSLPVTLAIVVPMVLWIIILFVTIYLPIITSAVMGNKADSGVLLGSFAVGLVIDTIVAVAMTIIHSLLIFAFPLIVDRNLSSWNAMKLSARASMKNIGGIGGLIVINLCLAVAGELAFCIGLYLMIPILTATSIVAYRKVFPALGPGNTVPPLPDVYQGIIP